jgi:hypothetical protein
LSTHALGTSDNGGAHESRALQILRNLDLVILVLALPLFIAADLPMAGYAAGAGAWIVQRAIKTYAERRAVASDDPRTMVGLMAGSMIGRGWLVALAIFGTGLAAGDDAGLAAAVLFLAVFTVQFTVNMLLRPFEKNGSRP